ncbi:hypothetical protein F7U66_01610 [Vibrio parahaemolyticus]|nr:hypothetical protein [Vibrio parahaemolyticus]
MDNIQTIQFYEHTEEVVLLFRDNSDARDHFYMVNADSANEAIDKVRQAGIITDGADHTRGDCCGGWFCGNVTESECEYNELMRLWIVPVYWRQNV